MPANLLGNLKPVRLKPSESCGQLKRHFKKGVLREVVGAWEQHVRKYGQDFIWVDHNWTIVHTDKSPAKARSITQWENYSDTMVKKAYRVARQLGIISRPFKKEIGGVPVRGFAVAPHDALCIRKGCYCAFVGPRNVKGTSWRAEMDFDEHGKPTGKVSIVQRVCGRGKPQGNTCGEPKGSP
jgi:hypothetical protein